MNDTAELKIELDAHIPWATGVVRRFAEKLGFSNKELGEIDLCVTELGNNLLLHKAINGKISFKEFSQDGLKGIEIKVCDEGPGIKDIDSALQDGNSTASSMGKGLGVVQRAADEFEIHSDTKGTKIKLRKYLPLPEESIPYQNIGLTVSVSVRTHPQSTVCGDGHVIRHTATGGKTLLSVIDGLGHGEKARIAAQTAEAYLHSNYKKPLTQIPKELHRVLHSTRGAVVGIALIDEINKKMDFIGVGNISARLWLPEEKVWTRPVSMSGTLGVSLRPPRIFSYPWQKGSILVMHSDGILDRWELQNSELNLPPVEISSLILRNHWRKNDDATVMVAR